MKKIIYILFISFVLFSCVGNSVKSEGLDVDSSSLQAKESDYNHELIDSLTPGDERTPKNKEGENQLADFSEEELLSLFFDMVMQSEAYESSYGSVDMKNVPIGLILYDMPEDNAEGYYTFSLYESYPERNLQTLHFEFDPINLVLYSNDAVEDRLVKQTYDKDVFEKFNK